jgi:large subunit ribosomal protein L30e
MSDLEEIKKNLKTDKIVIGTEETIKDLKLGKLKKVFLSANCKESVIKDITHYCGLSNTELVTLDIPNDELGISCRKQFPISVLSLLK